MDPLSARNPRVQVVRRLARQTRERADRRAFVVEGPVLVGEAIEAGVEMVALYVTNAAPPELLAEAHDAGIDLVLVSEAAMDSMATTVTAQPALGVAVIADSATLADVGHTPGHVLVLDHVRDPGNAGTILRSAEASGATAVVFSEGSVDAHNPKVVRASAGSLFRVPVFQDGATTAAAAIGLLTPTGRYAYGTATDGDRLYDQTDLTNAVIVLGNEAAGMSADTVAALDGNLRIPQEGGGESLNVAMAATVLCFEAARQRRSGPSHGDPGPRR